MRQTQREYNFFHWPELPQISCQCLTFGRPHLLNEAVESFLRQDYPGEKELIILNDHPEVLIEEFGHPEVHVFNVGRRFRTIGEERNACCGLCSGRIILPWDDDDISLPWRISLSLERMADRGYFIPDRFWFWSRGEVAIKQAAPHAMGAWSRELFDEVRGYPHLQSGQDQAIEQLFGKAGKRSVSPIEDAEAFYVYRFPGTGSYHLSAHGWGKGFEAAARCVARHVQPGRYAITPCWKQDYAALAASALPAAS